MDSGDLHTHDAHLHVASQAEGSNACTHFIAWSVTSLLSRQRRCWRVASVHTAEDTTWQQAAIRQQQPHEAHILSAVHQ